MAMFFNVLHKLLILFWSPGSFLEATFITTRRSPHSVSICKCIASWVDLFPEKNCGCLFIHKIISTRASMFPYDELIFNAKAENERNFRNIMSTLQVTSLSNSIHARKKRHCRHRLHGFTKGFSSLGLQLYETSLALRLSVSTTISDYLCININYIWYIGKCCLAILSDYISRLRWYTVNLNNWLKVNFCPNVW